MNKSDIIQLLYEDSALEFNFMEFVNPEDELSYLFDQWVPYYDKKYKICKAIQPKSILEIGVRYGYSAITFLKAAPTASYVGIDNDSEKFGGKIGAINWAVEITKDYDAQFVLGDTQTMKDFPARDHYDLIHVDGQQDGEGTYHDLLLALRKANWILVDGFHWSNENMMASNFFIKKYSEYIDFAIILPGYAGELLIKVKENLIMESSGYKALKNAYDKDYYLADCGGYDTFLKTKGMELDSRLKGIFNLANPNELDCILDIGCGRGELSFAMASAGAKVTGIDYSEEAIRIANLYYQESSITNRLNFINGDVLELDESVKFDKIIMADVFEHIDDEHINILLDKIKKILSPSGKLIIHTAPNRNYYETVYKKKYEEAKRLSLYLPHNPRSLYEDFMHINEQTPDTLSTTLSRYFEGVLVWTGQDGKILQNPKVLSVDEENEIYAICSIQDDCIKYVELLKSKALDKNLVDVSIQIMNKKPIYNIEDKIEVLIKNNGKETIESRQPYPVHISYHILDQENNVLIFEGLRTSITEAIRPLGEQAQRLSLSGHELKEGKYKYRICLVQEGQFWFESLIENCFLDILVELK